MKKQKSFSAVLFLPLLFLGLSACASVHRASGFFDDYSSLREGNHFKQEFVVPGTHFGQYQRVKVNPVELHFLEDPFHQYTQQEIEKFASDLKSALEIKLAQKYPFLDTTKKPDSKTLVVNPALIETTSPERLINALTAWFIGLQFSRGTASFEVKITDGGDGKLLAEVAEKRIGGGGLTDIKSIVIGGFFRFIHIEGAFNRWGKELLEFLEDHP